MDVDENNNSVSNSSSSEDTISESTGVDRSLSTHVMQSLYDFRQNNLLCDAVLRLEDGGVFPIHRAILSACSTYFRTLFTTTLHSKDETNFLLPNVTSKIMNLLLEYAYLRTLDVKGENVCELLITADYLSIFGVVELCCNYLVQNLTPENCISIMIFAREHFCKGLEKEAYRYILRNFVEVAERNNDIVNLPLAEVTSLISDDELNVKNEETVWELVLRWINSDPDNRKQHIVEFMRNIRLGLLDTQFFLEKVKEHPYVAKNEDCRPIIIETLKFLYDLMMITHKDGELPTPEIARPRVPHEILFAIGGWSGDSATSLIETYDTRADRWVSEVDPHGGRAYHGTAVVGYLIYVIGGFDGRHCFNGCRCFNAARKKWREVAPMNSRRAYVSVAVLDGMIYAMGGFDGYDRQNSAERYDHRRNQWSLIAPMNFQRSDASATTLNGKIYITGGFNGHESINSAEVYDPATNQWTMITSMRSRRSGVSCIAYHGYIYAIGGFNGISRICCGEKYNPVTNTWTRIPNMYNPRSNFGIGIIDDMIFAIGGYNGVNTTYHVECYDEKTNEWYKATDMNVNRSGLSACVVSRLPKVDDYIHKHRERLMEEKRQKLLALEGQQRHQQQNLQEQSALGSGGVNGAGRSNNGSYQLVLMQQANRRQNR
ncbi:hypothetical protein QAD02_001091 [Eretmocerus hayati]|uniref:Uncharacterized protein n=1 Tax=Eretmocerus hayati TaxID=131215 RepID=A0ACC2NFF3_9HYME|nr:hypothetical protein QAD02_001091 [Eretmocerus hayati]